MQTEIAQAVALFRNSPELGDAEIHDALVNSGVERVLASRLVEFVPMAYCRLILEQTGARFPETFERHREGGTISRGILLTSEPVWVAAIDFA